MATSSTNPEEARPPEIIVTNRKHSENERAGIAAHENRNATWTMKHDDEVRGVANNNYDDADGNLNADFASDDPIVNNNNNNNNNKVPISNTNKEDEHMSWRNYKETLKYVIFPKRPISVPAFKISTNEHCIEAAADEMQQINNGNFNNESVADLQRGNSNCAADELIVQDNGNRTEKANAKESVELSNKQVVRFERTKSRNSFHQDVEEALNSLLWQPYEYQNVYKNADSSSSSCSSTSSSCDLERSNNGPLRTKKSGNTADLHLRGEMVNNPASYENLLSQCDGGNRSRDRLALSNASRLMASVSSQECSSCAGSGVYSCNSEYGDCDDFCGYGGDMLVEVPSARSDNVLAIQTDADGLNATATSNNVAVNLTQHHGSANQSAMQRSCIPADGYQRSISTSSLSSANVVGLPNHPRHASVPSNRNLFPNHPRNSSEPINMVQSNQFKYSASNNVNCANIVSILNHQRHSSQTEPGGAHPVSHLRSASVPKSLPQQKSNETNVVHQRNGSDLNPRNNNNGQQRLPLNVSNVNVNYYRAVPVNVVSSVPTIQCVNSNDCNTNVSNVNIVQAMPVANPHFQNNTSNTCHYNNMSTQQVANNICTSSNCNQISSYGNSQLNGNNTYANINASNTYGVPTTTYPNMFPNTIQQCAVTTFGNSIITQHFPSGTTYNVNTQQHIPVTTTYNQVSTGTQINTQQYTQVPNQIVLQNASTVVPIATTEVTVHSTQPQIQVTPAQRSQTNQTQPTQEVRTRTFTSTEAQTDDTAVGATSNEASTSTNREQRRRERRERRHHRRVNSSNHRHTADHGTQWNGPQSDRLPDILHSHMPPPYASVNNVPNPGVLPNNMVPNPLVPPPGAVVQTMVPNNIVPSGIVGSPMVPFPPPVVPGQVPLVQGGAPVQVHVPSPTGFRFPFPAAGFRRARYSEEPPKSCCGLLAWKPGSLRWFIALIAVVAVCCVLVGTVLGAMRSSGRDHLTVSLLMIGVGIVLVTVSGVAWRLTSHDSPTCRSMLGLGSTESVDVCTRRFVPRLPPSYGRPHHPYAAMMYPEFQYRPPPPSYQASMQEYRLRLLLLDRGNTPQIQAGLQNAVSPPPTYRSHAGSLLRAPLSSRRDASQSEYSCPPSYRSQTSSTRPNNNTLPTPSVLHSREQSLSLSESNNDGSVNVVNILNNNDEDIALDNITLDSLKMEPESEMNPLKMLLKGSTSDLEGSKDGNLVTIVQTSDQSPVIVTVSGSSNTEQCNDVQVSEVQSEMQILAHL